MATPQSATIHPGARVVFSGYSELPEGTEPIFEQGQHLRIAQVNPDGSFVALPADGEGPGDTVFPEEVTMVEVSTDAPVAEAAPAPKIEAKAKGKAKSKAKAAEPVQEAPAVAEAPVPKVKAKAKTKAAEPVVETPEPMETAPVTETTAIVASGIVDTAAVQAILAEQDALDAAKSLVAQVEETYFTLGGVLHHINNEGIHKSLGYDGKRGFADYCDKELGIQYRKAMYLIDIYAKFRALGVDEKRLTEIGWSKAKELTNIATAENFDELVDYAKDHSRDEVVALKQSYVNGSEAPADLERVKKSVFKFALFSDQAEIAQRALDNAKDLTGSEDLSQAFEYICIDWLQLTESTDIPLEDAIRHLEGKYGVTIAVGEPSARAETAA